MATKNYWSIEGLSTEFNSLSEAKSHYSIYTANEIKNNEIPEEIYHHVNGEIISAVSVQGGKLVKFSRVIKIK